MANVQIKQNPQEDTTELWIHGKFVAGWNLIEIPTESLGILESMMRTVYSEAVKEGEQPLREAITRCLRG